MYPSKFTSSATSDGTLTVHVRKLGGPLGTIHLLIDATTLQLKRAIKGRWEINKRNQQLVAVMQITSRMPVIAAGSRMRHVETLINIFEKKWEC